MPRKADHRDPGIELHRIMKALLLAQLGDMKQRDQIALLDRAGSGQSQIAHMIGSTPNAVSVRLAEIRKAARKFRKR